MPDEEDERKRRPKPRQEPHYYQERPINYSTTCTIATVHAGTTRCAAHGVRLGAASLQG